MRAGVICEFNPFHNGHKFLLEKIKSEYADEIVCIMSGAFVQRGDLAITDKYARAEAALQNGADLVAEMPTVYALSSANSFAENGVRIAKELGCDSLCFGAENELNTLESIADEIQKDNFQRNVQKKMKSGLYYPRALNEAAAESLGNKTAEILSLPNNILGIEYIKACRKHHLRPVAVRRVGAAHDSSETDGSFASASTIRELIRDERDVSAWTPMRIRKPATISSLESAFLYRLKTMSEEELAAIADVSEGLHHRIHEIALKKHSCDEILEETKTKRYTMARLRRILCCAFLGITDSMQQAPVPYVRILGVRSCKTEMIRAEHLPLIVDVKHGFENMDRFQKEIFSVDCRATEAMNIALRTSLNEFSHGIIKL